MLYITKVILPLFHNICPVCIPRRHTNYFNFFYQIFSLFVVSDRIITNSIQNAQILSDFVKLYFNLTPSMYANLTNMRNRGNNTTEIVIISYSILNYIILHFLTFIDYRHETRPQLCDNTHIVLFSCLVSNLTIGHSCD